MKTLTIALLCAPLLAACEMSKAHLLKPPEEQAALRAMQTRVFDTTDEQATLRTALATLQDLGFVIDTGNVPLGIVSATKLEGDFARIMVTVKRQGEKQTAVRASLQVGVSTVTDPATYQEFFAALSKAMFLEAHAIE